MTDLDPQLVRDKMLELEQRFEGDELGLAAFAARTLGLEDGALDRTFSAEVSRTELLCAEWYTKRVAVLPNTMAMAAAMVQGLTFAVAVRLLTEDE